MWYMAGWGSACILAAVSLLLPSTSTASPLVFPDVFTAAEAGSADTAPLGTDIQRFQQVYGVSLLSSLSVGDQIVGLTFRVDGSVSALPAQTVANYEIRLTQSLNAPGSLSATFADNRGLDEVFVRTGSLVIQPGDFPGGSSPNSFGAMIVFTTPYTYAGGPLLPEVAHDGFPSGGRNVDADYPTSLAAQTAFGNGFGATVADAGRYNEAIIVQFEVSHAPESESFILMSLGILALMAFRRVRSA